MRLVRPPTVPYNYTELYIGISSTTEHADLAMSLVTQKAVAGNTSAWTEKARGCPVVSYVGTGAFTSERTFTMCTKKNEIGTSTFGYAKITLDEPLSLHFSTLTTQPQPTQWRETDVLPPSQSLVPKQTVVYDAAIFIGVVVTDTAATDVTIALLPRIQTATTDCWPNYLTDGPSGTAQYRGASIAIVLGGEPATCLCCSPFPLSL